MLLPGEQHASLLFGFLRTLGAGGNLTTDAHLAALAVEHDLEVCTTPSQEEQCSEALPVLDRRLGSL